MSVSYSALLAHTKTSKNYLLNSSILDSEQY